LGGKAPSSVRAQVDRLLRGLEDVLQRRIRGVYLHGSLALGCFNPARSDLDVLLVVEEPLQPDEKLALVDLLLDVSKTPHEIELDIVTTDQLNHWRHPSAHELHYSEWSRERFMRNPARRLGELSAPNPDLAAHVALTRAVGISVVGLPPREVLPEIPFEHYRDALLQDLEWARTVRSETYGILSPCRIWATLATGEIHSKVSGSEWALERLPDELKPPVEAALAAYTGAANGVQVDDSERQKLFAYVDTQVRQ
jgi:streptomycin 3"-adenylyltransferase